MTIYLAKLLINNDYLWWLSDKYQTEVNVLMRMEWRTIIKPKRILRLNISEIIKGNK